MNLHSRGIKTFLTEAFLKSFKLYLQLIKHKGKIGKEKGNNTHKWENELRKKPLLFYVSSEKLRSMDSSASPAGWQGS